MLVSLSLEAVVDYDNLVVGIGCLLEGLQALYGILKPIPVDPVK